MPLVKNFKNCHREDQIFQKKNHSRTCGINEKIRGTADELDTDVGFDSRNQRRIRWKLNGKYYNLKEWQYTGGRDSPYQKGKGVQGMNLSKGGT